jgi:hypothetical protein
MIKQRSKASSVVYSLSFLSILLLLHSFFFKQLFPFDYDAAHNYQIIREIHQGDWHNLFHHASPVFYLFFSFFHLFFKDFESLLAINIFVYLAAVWVLHKAFSPFRSLSILFFGSSFLLVSSAHYFSIEALSLLASAVVWYKTIHFLQESTSFFASKSSFFAQNATISSQKFFEIGFWSGITLLINYKFVVVMAFWGLALLIFRKNIGLNTTFFFKVILFFTIGLFIPILLMMVLGSWLGLRIYQYPATLYSIFTMASKPNPNALQCDFYLQYLIMYEYILYFVFLVLLAKFAYAKRHRWSVIEKITLVVWVGSFFVMSFLPKAPRGLIFVIPLACGFCLLSFEKLKETILFQNPSKSLSTIQKSFTFLICAASVLSFMKIHQSVTPYTQSNYPQVARYLKEQKAQVVFTTLGKGIAPYLDTSIRLITLREAQDSVWFGRFEGKKFLLYDAFYQTANHNSFDIFRDKKSLRNYAEASVLNPMLHLEHCEYTGFSFRKGLEQARKMQKDTIQLRIIPLP